jgi:hypothetical protein
MNRSLGSIEFGHVLAHKGKLVQKGKGTAAPCSIPCCTDSRSCLKPDTPIEVVDHDKFREELLENCFKIFSQKGYSKVSIRDIAKETGLSTGSIYHYFKNKADILEQMFSYIRKKNFVKILLSWNHGVLPVPLYRHFLTSWLNSIKELELFNDCRSKDRLGKQKIRLFYYHLVQA